MKRRKGKRRGGKNTSAISHHRDEPPGESRPFTRPNNAEPSSSSAPLEQAHQPNANEDACALELESKTSEIQVRALRKRKATQDEAEPLSPFGAPAALLNNKRRRAEPPSNLFLLLPKDILLKILNMLDDVTQVFTVCKTCKDLYKEYWNISDALDKYQFRTLVPLIAPEFHGKVKCCLPLRRYLHELGQIVALHVEDPFKNTPEFLLYDMFRGVIRRIDIDQSHSGACHPHNLKHAFVLRNQDLWAVFACQTCVFHINNVFTGQLLCMLTVKPSEIRGLHAPYDNGLDQFFLSDDCKFAVANIGEWPVQRLVIWNLEELHKPRRYPSRNPVVISGKIYAPPAPHAFDYDDLRFDRENRYILAVRDEDMVTNNDLSRRYGSVAVFDIKCGKMIRAHSLFTNIPVDDKMTFYTRIMRFNDDTFAVVVQRDITVIIQKWEISLERAVLVREFCLTDFMMDIDQEEDIFMSFANNYDNLRPLNLEHRQLNQLCPRLVSWDKVLDEDLNAAQTIAKLCTTKPAPSSGNGFKSLVIDTLNVLGHASSDMSSLITLDGKGKAVMWYNLLK